MGRTLVSCAVLCLLAACSSGMVAAFDDHGVAAARRRANELVAGSPTTFFVKERADAAGRFAYVELASREPGRLTTRWAVMPYGRLLMASEAERIFDERHRAEWGSIELESARRLVRRGDDASSVRILGHFDPTAVSRSELRDELSALDAPAAYFSEALPLFEATVTRAELLQLARREGIRLLQLADDGAIRKTAVSYPSPVPASEYIPSTSLTTNSDIYANAKGIYGKGVNVGIMESYLFVDPITKDVSGCRLDEMHESLANIGSVNYQQNAMPCVSDSKCNWCGDPNKTSGRCVNGACVDVHASEVASRIAASQLTDGGIPSGGFHAAGVNLYVEHNRPNEAYTQSILENVYSWFDSNDVRLVNISAVSDSPGHGRMAVYADWYARMGGFVVVQSAGNKKYASDVTAPYATVTCQGFNTICVGGFQSYRAEPRVQGQYYLSPISRFLNLADNDWEFEKPDIVAESDYAHVMDVGTTSDWLLEFGTSFSAPTVTGLIALHLDFCNGEPGVRDSAFYRAFLRSVAAYIPSVVEVHTGDPAPNPDVDSCPPGVSTPLYPNVAIGCDHKGGAGVVKADYMFVDQGTCGVIEDPECETPPCPFSGTGSLDAESGWTPVPHWAESSIPSNDNSTRAALRIPHAEYVVLRELGDWAAGSRLRATFAYYACPASLWSAAADGAPAVNIDLALVGRNRDTGQPEVIQASEGRNDATEGFDVTLLHDYSDVAMWAVSPGPSSADWHACNGVKEEPYWWWAMWTPAR